MPTARELLEQADALMRRNRRDEPERASPSADRDGWAGGSLGRGQPDIPTLDEDVVVDHDAPLTPTVILPEYAAQAGNLPPHTGFGPALAPERALEAPGTLSSEPADIGWTIPEGRAGLEWIETLADLPVLTDAVEVASLRSSDPVAVAESLPAPESPAATGMPAMTGIAATSGVSASEAAVPSGAAPGDRSPASHDWSELADEIRSQVLQRLDLFTDTGLREQLGAHLQPIVDRASAELVDAINCKVGELVRSYVAEAIEREIDAWRHRDG